MKHVTTPGHRGATGPRGVVVDAPTVSPVAATPGCDPWYAGRAALAAIRVGGVRGALAGRIGSWV